LHGPEDVSTPEQARCYCREGGLRLVDVSRVFDTNGCSGIDTRRGVVPLVLVTVMGVGEVDGGQSSVLNLCNGAGASSADDEIGASPQDAHVMSKVEHGCVYICRSPAISYVRCTARSSQMNNLPRVME
jgi:hypothetical protein